MTAGHDRRADPPSLTWVYALTIRDLGRLVPNPATASSQELLDVWQANWTGLGDDEAAVTHISNGIDRARDDVLDVLAALD